MSKIIVEYGKLTEIARRAGLCTKTVRKVLRGDTTVNEVASRKVRRIAIECGGVEKK